MNTVTRIAALTLALAGIHCSAQTHKYTVETSAPVAQIQPTMYGVFFEDINFAADGGLYAEMVENRSFEAPQQFQGWDVMGKAILSDSDPAFERNPHYASMLYSGHKEKHTGMTNRGYFGMGIKAGASYEFSVYARKHDPSSQRAVFTVELLDRYQNVMSAQTFTVTEHGWNKFTAVLKSRKTDSEGSLRLMLSGVDGVDIEHVSLFPSDNWNGLRSDLVQDLADLNPGIIRFPGGCIVEGSDLETRYQWKNTVGPAENRPMNENRWNNTYTSKYAPSYYQSLGLGFYEFFLLAEKIGAEPLPIISAGLACQFHNNTMDAHVPVDELGPYVEDALDLIEFANGPVTSKWGKVRSDMGHPAPFNLKFLGVGNEQWGTVFPERLEVFVEAIRAKYPDIKLVGSAGPSSSGDDFNYLWTEMNRLGADLVDEHYYNSPSWFLTNAQRYDSYDRSWPKVFAGEYAAHIHKGSAKDRLVLLQTPAPAQEEFKINSGLRYSPGMPPKNSVKGADITDIVKMPQYTNKDQAPLEKNNFFSALCEAAFMTGLERNADIVHMATYAPLLAHVKGWQWDPDLIWFDNLKTVRTPNYYVQQMYGQNSGTDVLSILEGGKKIIGEDGLYATACFDKTSGDYIVKIVNAAADSRSVSISFKGLKSLGEGTVTTLHAGDLDYNTIENSSLVAPVKTGMSVKGNVLDVTIPARSFQVYRF